MKHLKTYQGFHKLNETGEWDHSVDWEYVKEHPEADDECSNWIKSMEESLIEISDFLDHPEEFEIKDIEGFDMYQGPYALVEIKGRTYKIWYSEGYKLWIDNFPVDNTSGEGKRPGLKGFPQEIAEEINNMD